MDQNDADSDQNDSPRQDQNEDQKFVPGPLDDPSEADDSNEPIEDPQDDEDADRQDGID